jgi:hypothetical protein
MWREREKGEKGRGKRERGRVSRGQIESYASTVLQPAEDKMRKTLGLTVYSAKYSSPLSSDVGLAGCH